VTGIILLLALSALIGFALGTSFSWFAIAASSVGIAVLSSMILQIQGFSSLPGIGVVVALLTINQMAYSLTSGLFEKQADKEPSQGRDGKIA
jgi:membrane protein implicated in regulation of membrane protease activity